MKETSRVHCCSCGGPVALQIDKDGLRRALASHWRDDLATTVLQYVTVRCGCAAPERGGQLKLLDCATPIAHVLRCLVCNRLVSDQALAAHVAREHPVAVLIPGR